MGRKIKYEIAGRTFTTQSALRETIQGILYACPLGEPLAADDFDLMFGVLKLQGHADLKIGMGVHQIFTDSPPDLWSKKNRCFYVAGRTDRPPSSVLSSACETRRLWF